jgi:hypothetical protein
MKDTPKHVADMQRSLAMSKTPGERFCMTIDMYETSRAFVKASLKNERPKLTEAELNVEIFKRFYKNDFHKEELDKIIQHLFKTV